MSNKLLGVMLSLIFILSSIFVIGVLTNDSIDSDYEDTQDYSSGDILSELDNSLLDENQEIEIGEMV